MGDEEAAAWLEKRGFAIGGEKMKELAAWVLWGYPGCVNALMGEYWIDHDNARDGMAALQIAALRGDSVGACRTARLLWKENREKAKQVVRDACKRAQNAELAIVSIRAGRY